MSWNYRIIKQRMFAPPGNDELAPNFYIGEVYYADDGKSVHSWSTPEYNPLQGDSAADLKEQLKMIQEALDRPIFEIPLDQLEDGSYAPGAGANTPEAREHGSRGTYER